ncbi:MAG TPA: glycosyltransferase family 39 protein [Anaeromyxobacteraceae bacterium]|nr:glycosyltransferase family 39 protein [Anaeromyxobacteraceae bacterium]
MTFAELATRFERRPRLATLALAAVVAFAFQGSRGLYESTEGRYAESAFEMVRSGTYLEPTLSGRPHLTKPPLAYWTIAAGVRVAGPNGWGARLSNAILFCLTVLVVSEIGAALWDRTTGVVAGLVYLSSPFPAAAAAVVSTDTLLALLELLAIWLYLRARAVAGAPAERRWIRAMWVAWALAFLTKGPPGLLPLIAIFAFERLAPRRVRLAEPIGLSSFAALALSWYAWEIARRPDLLRYFLLDEVIGRVATNEFHRNPEWWKPFAIYLPVLLLGQGAWFAFGARLLARERLASPRAVWARLRRADAASFLLLWLLLPLAAFWLSSSRLPLYVLPVYAAIALGVARAVVRAAEVAALRRTLAVALPSVLAIVLLKAGAAYAAPASKNDMRLLYEAARRAGGPAAEVRAFDESKLYGLQYYLAGALRRVSPTGKEPWADERLDETIRTMSRERDRTWVVVSPPSHAAELDAALHAAGLTHRRVPAASRDLFVVPDAPATADPLRSEP